MKLAVLASGSGTILDAILRSGLPVDFVLTDRPCPAIGIATDAGVDAIEIERTDWGSSFDRDGYTRQLVQAIPEDIDLVVMAGYGTILGPAMYERFPGQVLNTHPALLPSFKGWHAVRQALDYGVRVTGCTVHVATEAVDEGPILAQRPVEVKVDDTEESLHERIKVVERRLYVETLRNIVARGYVLQPA